MINSKDVLNNMESPVGISEGERKLKLATRIIIILSFFILLSLSYVTMFTVRSTGTFGTKAVGVLNTNNFHEANFGDLIIIKPIDGIRNIKSGNIIVYKLNGVVGTCEVSSIDYNKNVIYYKENNIEKHISYELVLGLEKGKVAVLGLILGFLSSPIGSTILSVLLLAYVYHITFSRVNKEESLKGKLLLEQYRIEKAEIKARKKLLAQFRKTDGFSPEDSNIIDGTMGDNLIELVSYTKTGQSNNITETYKYILEKVHRTYMTRPKLSKMERVRVSNVVEMSPIVDYFDESMSYKLIDLVLHEPISDFDVNGFEKLSKKFLTKNLTADDLTNFGGLLYVLLEKNTKLNGSAFSKVITAYYDKVMTNFKDEEFGCYNLAIKLKTMLKK